MKFIIKVILLSSIISHYSFADVNDVKNKFLNSLENYLSESFENTDFSIRSIEETKPEIGIQTFRPFDEDDDGLMFFQGSLFIHDGDRETINLGIGKRSLLDDDSILIGLNAFYDYVHDYSHQRISLGADVKSSILNFYANQYYSLSGSETGKNNKSEEAIDGFDLEIGAHVPYIPSLTLYAKAFDFEVSGGNDFQGLEYSSELKFPNSGFIFEFGHTDYDHHNDETFFNLKYSSNNINPNTSLISREAYEKISMVNKKYDKVRRDNIIVKKGSGFTVKAGGF